MTALDFYKVFGGLALTLIGTIFGYLLKRNSHEVSMDERVKTLEKWKAEADKCLEKVQAKEAQEALRQYRQDENDRKLNDISNQITGGFDRMSGAINAVNLQMVEVVAKAANTDASLKQAWARIEAVETGLGELRRAVEGVQADLRSMRYREEEP